MKWGDRWGDKRDDRGNPMGKLNPKQVENLTEPGTYEDGDWLRLVVKSTGRNPGYFALNCRAVAERWVWAHSLR